MESELARHAETLFGERVVREASGKATESTPPSESPDAPAPADNTPALARLKLTPRQERRLWQHVESIENFWQTLKEIEPGVIQRLGSTAAQRRWEIIFLTKRPETVGLTAQVQTQRWLESKGFPLPSVFVVQGSRGRIADALALDIVIDDRPENCLDVIVDSKARAILIWHDDQNQLPAASRRLGIGVVKSVNECLDVLVEVDSPEPERSGLIARVKRAFGRKEPANA